MEEGQASSSPRNNLGNNSDDDIRNLGFDEGCRFDPTDEELIVEYLIKKIKKEELPPNKIQEVDLYLYNPETLAARFKPLAYEKWYFFTSRTRKYRNGERPNRATGDGYWKTYGYVKPISVNGIEVGTKMALEFYIGAAPNGTKSNWMMHEYIHKTSAKRQKEHDQDMKLDDWVLCRMSRASPMNDDAATGVIPDTLSTTSGISTTTDTDSINISSGFSTPISHAETPLSNPLPLMISNYNAVEDFIPFDNLQNNYSAHLSQSFPQLRELFPQVPDRDSSAEVSPELATQPAEDQFNGDNKKHRK